MEDRHPATDALNRRIMSVSLAGQSNFEAGSQQMLALAGLHGLEQLRELDFYCRGNRRSGSTELPVIATTLCRDWLP